MDSSEDKRKELNPQIVLDDSPMHAASDFKVPEGWSRREIAFYFEKALTVLNGGDFTTAQEYIDLLVNQCLAEKHWSDAFTYFLTKIKEMGLEIETAQKSLNDLNERLFYWRTVRMMIHAAGLMRYEDEIIKYEIAKYYQPTPQILPPPRTREVPIDRPKRAKPVAKPSVLRPELKPKSEPKPKATVPVKPPVRFNKPNGQPGK